MIAIFQYELQPLITARAAGDTEQALREEIELLRELLDEATDDDKEPDYGALRECVEMIDMVIGR